jgi:hypothetical protein
VDQELALRCPADEHLVRPTGLEPPERLEQRTLLVAQVRPGPVHVDELGVELRLDRREAPLGLVVVSRVGVVDRDDERFGLEWAVPRDAQAVVRLDQLEQPLERSLRGRSVLALRPFERRDPGPDLLMHAPSSVAVLAQSARAPS